MHCHHWTLSAVASSVVTPDRLTSSGQKFESLLMKKIDSQRDAYIRGENPHPAANQGSPVNDFSGPSNRKAEVSNRFGDMPTRRPAVKSASGIRLTSSSDHAVALSKNPAQHAPLKLGSYGPHQGLFVGEIHDERDTMSAFEQNLPDLVNKIDVILLEYYPAGLSPQGKSAEEIEADLGAFNKSFGKGEAISKEIYRVCQLASKNGVAVRGIEVPTPKGSESGPRYLAWRMSAECNQAFLNCADKYAAEIGRPGVSFCMYGGLTHWIKLKRLAPEMPGYRVRDGKLGLI